MKIFNLFFVTFLFFGCYNFSYKPEVDYIRGKFNNNQDYVSVIEGNMPVILIVSHSGKITFTNIKKRKNVHKSCDYNINNDLYTDEIAFKLSDILYKNYNKRPYIVINNIHRKYLDLNRLQGCSYGDDKLEKVYNEFHTKIKNITTKIKSEYGDGILIDIHGQISYDGDVFIGTHGDETLNYDLDRKFISNLFIEKGYILSPDSHWKGGFIVKKYGKLINHRIYSSKALSWKLNAFQIEIDKKYRYSDKYDGNAVRHRFCWDFADIVMDILKKIEIN